MQSTTNRAPNRRDLLKGSAGFALFPWVVLGDVPEARRFEEAYQRASKAGRPLVVVVIPEEQLDRIRNGVVMGVFLDLGSDEDLAPLAIADLVCARTREIATSIPAVTQSVDPFLFVVFARDPEAHSKGEPNFAVLRLDWTNGEWGLQRDPDQRFDPENHAIRLARAQTERRREIAAFLREQMERASSTLATRQRRTFAQYEIEAVERGSPSNELLTGERVRAASAIILRRLGKAEPNDMADFEARLAAIVRASFVRPSPEGAEWAVPTNCGFRFESKRVNTTSGPCGMGSAGAGEKRFLYFLTDERKTK